MKLALMTLVLLFSSISFANPTIKVEFDVQSIKNKTDILFVIDNSGSMSHYQNALASGSDILVEELKNIDFRITGIDTDSQVTSPAVIIDNSNRDPLNALKKLMTSFGTNGSYQEQPFQNINDFMLSNQGSLFLRKKIPLEIIILTDEEDQSELQVEDMVDLFKGRSVTVNSIIPFKNSFCYKQPRNNEKLEELTAQTSGVLIDICESEKSFRTDYRDLAQNIVERSGANESRKPPVAKYHFALEISHQSLFVTYGTQIIQRGLIHTGWTYDENNNVIHFGKDIELSTQPEGTKFIIQYQAK